MPVSFAPVRQPGPPVIADIHVHDRTAAGHGDGHPGGIGGVLDRVRHEFTGQQLSIHRGGVIGQGVPDELAGDRHLFGAPGEGPRGACGGGRGRRARRGPAAYRVSQALLLGHGPGRTGHIGLHTHEWLLSVPTM